MKSLPSAWNHVSCAVGSTYQALALHTKLEPVADFRRDTIAPVRVIGLEPGHLVVGQPREFRVVVPGMEHQVDKGAVVLHVGGIDLERVLVDVGRAARCIRRAVHVIRLTVVEGATDEPRGVLFSGLHDMVRTEMNAIGILLEAVAE